MKRWLGRAMLAILLGLAALASLCQAPANVVSAVSLGPSAGNGLKPIRAEVDAKRRRLYVLNQQTRNISVVDLRRRRVLAVVPLGDSWTAENRTRLLFDPVSDHIFVTGPVLPGFQGSRIISISAARLRVVATQEVEKTLLADAVLLPGRHELVTSAWRNRGPGGWGMDVFDTHTLEPRRRIPTASEIVAMAADEDGGRIYTAEPDIPMNNSLGTMGPYGYGSARIVARDALTGQVRLRSAKLSGVHQIIVDGRHGRLLVPFSDQSRVLGLNDVIAVLDRRDLSCQYVTSFRRPGAPQEDPQRRPLFSSLRYDRAHDTLVAVPSLSRFSLAMLNLKTGRAHFSGKDQPNRLDSVAAVDEQTGTAITLTEHGIHAYRTPLSEGAWSLPVGAEISQLLVDRGRRRALVVTQSDRPSLQWVGLEIRRRTKTRRNPALPPSWSFGFDQIIAADFERGSLYYTLPTIYGGGGYLGRWKLSGSPDSTRAQPTPAHLYLMALAPDGKRSYRGYVNFNSENDAWVGEYEGERLLRKVPVPGIPARIVYAPRADKLFLLYPGQVRTFDGQVTTLPPTAGEHGAEGIPRAVAADVSADGRFAYHVDASSRLLSVVRLADGAVTASSRLSFSPSSLDVDERACRAYLVDWLGGRIVTIQLPGAPGRHVGFNPSAPPVYLDSLP